MYHIFLPPHRLVLPSPYSSFRLPSNTVSTTLDGPSLCCVCVVCWQLWQSIFCILLFILFLSCCPIKAMLSLGFKSQRQDTCSEMQQWDPLRTVFPWHKLAVGLGIYLPSRKGLLGRKLVSNTLYLSGRWHWSAVSGANVTRFKSWPDMS